jgi:hypothetical protein
VIRIHLSEREAGRLEQAFLQATDRKLHDRLQIIRLAHRGRPHQDIAADLGVTPRTVQRWLNAYLERGLDGLKPRKASPYYLVTRWDDLWRWFACSTAGVGLVLVGTEILWWSGVEA